MAYQREWDRRKDTWNDVHAWDGPGSSKGARHRDEEYNDGKRRKFNDGGYDGGQGYNDYGHGGHDRAPKKRMVPSEPSPHVIFLGLDQDFTEADLQAYLTSNGCSVETVTIIRDRSSGVSKGFGFAQFTSTEHAKAFVGPLFPFIQVPPPASHGATASAAFYKALETGVPHNGRRVKIDYSQSASPHDKGRRQNMNDGTRDIGNSQAPVLLFRGLDPLTGPQAISQAMRASSGLGKEGAKGMKRIIVIKDKVTMASFGFAFIEFIDVQSASTALAATMSPQIHPSGFRISDKPVAASFAHAYSFQPATEFLNRDEACIPSSLSLGGVEGSWVRYWDETSSVAVLDFKVEEPAPATIPATKGTAKDKKEKKRKAGDSDILPASDAVQLSALPLSDKPVMLSFNKGAMSKSEYAATSGPSKSTTSVALALSSADDPAEESDGAADPASSAEDGKGAKKVAPLIASRKVVNNISKWNQVQQELSHDAVPAVTSPTPAAAANAPDVNQPVVPAAATVKSAPPPSQEMEFEFSDTVAMTCLLCARQFKALDQLKRHNKESELHKKNFKDSNLREVARQKVSAARQAAASGSSEHPKYRDRASERRIMHNQPEVPLPTPVEKEKASKKKQHAEGPPPAPTPPPPGEDQNNVGNKLLKMMGWTEGSGLGSTGEGRVEPIQTAMYAQGAGLGASKGREVGKYTEGYSGYVDVVKDAARQRYGT